MKISRFGQVAALALAGSIALAGCGSDDNTGSGASGSSSAAGAAAAADCFEGTLNAEGSSAQKNAFEEAAASFIEKCPGATVNYNPTGSGAGIKQFIAGQVDFAGSDSALKTEEKDGVIEADAAAKMCGSPAWNIPMVTGPIAIAYNVHGRRQAGPDAGRGRRHLQRQDHHLERPGHRRGQPGRDPAVDRDQGLLPLRRVGHHRELHQVPQRRGPRQVDRRAGQGLERQGRGQGEVGRCGRGREVHRRRHHLRRVELRQGQQPGHRPGRQRGRCRRAHRRERRQGASRRAKPDGEGNDLRLKLDYATKEAGAYPILLVTYEIVCSKNKDATKAANIKAFLTHFASPETQKSLEEIGYAPLPASVQSQVATAIQALS